MTGDNTYTVTSEGTIENDQLTETWKHLGTSEFDTDKCKLVMLDNEGNIYEIKLLYSKDNWNDTQDVQEEKYNGWFAADGTPMNWSDLYNYNKANGINVKFYQAFYSSQKPNKFLVCHYKGMTTNDGDTYSLKWAIINETDKKAVIYSVNVVFNTPINAESITETLNGGDKPQLWGKYGKDGVIQMYIGGWKYSDKSALKEKYTNTTSSYKNNGGTDKTDEWDVASILKNYGDGNGVTYYQYYFEKFREKSYTVDKKGDNARSEFLEDDIPGKYKHTFAKRKNEFGKGNPFTVPCFGTFLKFEPEQNGYVSVYIVQNGIIHLSDEGTDDGGLQTEPKWRPTYIVDELGNQLTDDKDGVTAELPKKRIDNKDGAIAKTDDGQKIYIGWDGSYIGTLATADDANKTAEFAKNVQSESFTKKLSDENWIKLTGYAKGDIYKTNKLNDDPYWTTGGTVMRMMPPSDSGDGWIAINKTYVKYTFPVKAGKSYYVFNNDSQIGYSGYEFVPNDDMNNSVTPAITDGETDYKLNPGTYAHVTVTRPFKQGWNAICLPFSVTESKMREWFGSNGNKEDYELVTYNGCAPTKEGEPSTTKDGSLTAHFFRHAYQDILAGYPYMLYIPYGAKILQPENNNTLTFSNITIEDNVEMATFRSSHDYMDNSKKSGNIYCSRYTLAEEDDYEFKGTFVPMNVPVGSYAVYSTVDGDKVTSTGIRYVASETPMNGLRAYLHPAYLDKNTNAKAVARIVGTNFSDAIDDSMWNDATVINDLMEEMGFFDQRENVYSVTGQIVRQNTTSLVGLPKGVYIVKGKKYFVK